MIGDVKLISILIMPLAASLGPGPASLVIAGTSMASGRKTGLLLNAGAMVGSVVWSVAAALEHSKSQRETYLL